jgi:hypothetical protein
MAEADREKLIDRIKKLRAKGSDKSVSEEEANTFLDAAARMMAENTVTDEDLLIFGIDVEEYPKRGAHTSPLKAHPACLVCDSIAALTGTAIGFRVTYKKGREIGSLTISGRKPDREIASYMFDQVQNLIDATWRAERRRRLQPIINELKTERYRGLKLSDLLRVPELNKQLSAIGNGVGSRERKSFGLGMAYRMDSRIHAMAVRKGDAEAAKGVWEKKVTVTEHDNKSFKADTGELLRGFRAGNEVELGAGVGAGSGQQKLEKM